jgi:hypothetical protein
VKHTFYVSWGDLYHYMTGEQIRSATKREEKASKQAARHDGGAGVIDGSELSWPIARRKLRVIERKLTGNG